MQSNFIEQRLIPNFAVFLAAFNGIKWLPEQVDSILDQRDVSLKVFVSIDRSDDGTEEWFRSKAIEDDRIVLLQYGNVFGGAAQNFFHLIKTVNFDSFDYVCFADQDDIWLADKLVRAHNCINNNIYSGYSSNVVAFWADGRTAFIEKAKPQVKWDYLFESAGPGCTFVLKNKLLLAFKEFLINNEDLIKKIGSGQHDWLIYAYSRAHNYRWVIDKWPGMLYRQHSNNHVGVNIGLRALLFRANKIFNGWWLSQSKLISELVGFRDDKFVAYWFNGGRIGLLSLAAHAFKCRRGMRDKLLFLISCVILSVIGLRKH